MRKSQTDPLRRRESIRPGEPWSLPTSETTMDKPEPLSDDILARAERDELVQKVYELESERDALRADAERYQWLRGRDLNTIAAGGVFAGMTPQNIVINGADLDSRIDAERAAEGNPNA
ncbi:MAG: hypothetical protein J0H09_28150 [Burkholderiales bacterium]|nr:hypothetical protein [Burkholderiales bacterium]